MEVSISHTWALPLLASLDFECTVHDSYIEKSRQGHNRPSLKSDIQNVTCLLSVMIEDRCLPDQKLWLEMLTDEQITSGELATNSLEELSKFTDEASYFTHSDPSHSATEGSPSPGEQGNASTSF